MTYTDHGESRFYRTHQQLTSWCEMILDDSGQNACRVVGMASATMHADSHSTGEGGVAEDDRTGDDVADCRVNNQHQSGIYRPFIHRLSSTYTLTIPPPSHLPRDMPSPRRPLSSSSGSGSSPPPRPPESPTEVLYNTAVQSFVRRDHLKTHAALARLLSTLKGQSRKQARRRWHDLSASTSGGGPVAGTSTVNGGSTASDSREADNEVEEWLIKTFKLYISAHASLYSDPPSQSAAGTLSTDLLGLIPPHTPSKVLEHVTNTALQAYPDGILPPPVISTLVLASLKLQPQDDALSYTHRVTEEWLANLPNAFMEGISLRERGGVSKRVEAGREGYLKVLELFTGEVLAREGEWEMARGILDGDTLMGSKRKEVS